MISASAIAGSRSCEHADCRNIPIASGYRAAPRVGRHARKFTLSLVIRAVIALKHFGRGLLTAREANAARSVGRHLACHSDRVLLAAGFSSEDIARLRRHGAG